MELYTPGISSWLTLPQTKKWQRVYTIYCAHPFGYFWTADAYYQETIGIVN